MSILYVDVDDTLVKWADALEGRLVTDWEPNEAVIEYARAWKGKVVVWSSGGRDYAEMWSRRLLPGIYDEAMAKYPAIMVEGDVALDDMPFDVWRHRAIHPRDLVAREPMEAEEQGT